MNPVFNAPAVCNAGPLIGLARIDMAWLPFRLFLTELDAGEASVISSAGRLGLSTVILDERKARRIASRVHGLHAKGAAGLLVEAKNRKMIETVRPHLEGMIQRGYFIGPNLVATCLTAAGE